MPLTRRKFLKLLGLGGASTLTGCSDYSPTRLIPYLYPPEDIIPGKALWYASTCRECPAGCGLLAKNRDGRVIKVEGNPVHPVSDGKLCPRGQASLQGLYNPDRFPGPMMKNRNGRFDPITWEKGETILARSLEALVQKKRGEKIVFVSELINGSLKELIDLFLSEMKGSELLFYEPLSYEDLRKANQAVFQLDGLPHYRIDRADFLISLGAGFLETWLSNLEFARQFALFHSLKEKGKNPFIYVGPRLSMTANNADQWIGVPPGDEYLIALGLLQILLADGQQVDFPGELKTVALQALQGFSLDRISQKTRVPVDVIKDLARRFDQSERPLVLAEGLGLSGTRSYEAAVAANLLCLLKPGSRKLMDFKSQLSLGQAASLDRMQNLTERMKKKEVDLLFLGQVNPVFTLPFSSDFQEGLSTVPLVVSFSSYPDETCRHAHLILPNHTFLESWGDYSPRSGVLNLMQPVMGPVFQTRHTGDVLMAAGRKISSPETFPWKDFYAFLKNSWSQKVNEWGPGLSSEEFWQRAMEKGGVWKKPGEAELKFTLKTRSLSFPPIEPASATDQRLDLTVYPTVQFFDGRQANRPWIQELPDPLTQVTWDGWLEIHPETALARGIQKGDMLLVRSPFGSQEVPAYPVPTVPPGTVAMPIGQGHWNFGRYADAHPANPWALLAPDIGPTFGGRIRPALKVSLQKLDKTLPMAHVDGSYTQQDRSILQTMKFREYQESRESGKLPAIDLPLPEGRDPRKDFYPAHQHKDYRWCMVVDLDRCIGCSACVVACYAENNLAVVEKKQVLNGREMAWIRIQRYFDPKAQKAYWLPMLCQHCDFAPCESVCPVYAPHHSIEGLNNQVYNRCIGTRFCLQNDPYKVRRFNWFTYTRPKPLDWQLNPDVTVRNKGVMEKCSFCVQRIIDAKIKAKAEDRKVKDGEFTTACAQTCPADVLTFGNLLDPESRVSRLIKDTRRYQVMGYLNTKPAVIYLKKVEG